VVVDMTMSAEAKEARNRYLREWRKSNPESVKKHQANYWEKIADKQAAEEKVSQ